MDLFSYTHKGFGIQVAVSASRTLFPFVSFVVFGPLNKDVRAAWFPKKRGTEDEPTSICAEATENPDSPPESPAPTVTDADGVVLDVHPKAMDS